MKWSHHICHNFHKIYINLPFYYSTFNTTCSRLSLEPVVQCHVSYTYKTRFNKSFLLLWLVLEIIHVSCSMLFNCSTRSNYTHVSAPLYLVEHTIFYCKCMYQVRNVTRDSAALSVYASVILAFFSILFFPLDNGKICCWLSHSSYNDIDCR